MQTLSFSPPRWIFVILVCLLACAAQAQTFSYFTNTGPLNVARYSYTATLLTNGTVMIAGGFSTHVGEVATTETYDPATGIWSTNQDMLDPRSDHTATLLLNGKVLVTGGDNFTGAVTDSELYDFSSGSWTNTGFLKQSRSWHVAARLPNGNVFVGGGYDFNDGYISSCEVYNPTTQAWTNTGSLNYARVHGTATALNNGKILIVGGDGQQTCELYDPVLGVCTMTGSNSVARSDHTATLLNDGTVLVAGGSGDYTAEIYNPATGQWTNTFSMVAARVNATATLLPDGMVLVAGGFDSTDNTNILISTELYDPASGIWSTNFDMTQARAQHTATLLPNGNVLIAGGTDSIGEIDTAELYFSPPPVPSPGIWTATAAVATNLYLNTATLLPNGKVLTTGGTDNDENVYADVRLYDPASGTWQSTNALHQARFAHTATLLTNGLVLVAGGITSYDSTALVQTVELFNPATGTWTNTGPMNFPRYGHTATLLANGKVLVAGGTGTNTTTVNLTYIYPTEVYDPHTGIWTATGPLLKARSGHTATLLPNGKVLIVAGETTNSLIVTSECEIFDPATNGCAQTAFLTYVTANHSATLLPSGLVLIAAGDTEFGSFGGVSLVPNTSAALFDYRTETWTSTGSLNAGHDFHTATLLTNGLVLIAGYSTYNSTNDSAELFNSSVGVWYPAAPMKFPRIQHTATLLPNGEVFVQGGLMTTAELYSTASASSDGTVVPFSLTNATKLSGGAFRFNFTNAPGTTFTVFTSTNAATAFSNWSTVTGVSEVTPGNFQFTDTQNTNSSQRYYRVRTP